MKKIVFVAAVASAMSTAFTYADELNPGNQFAYNISVTSDYRYRGLSQTRLKPAVQGGFDYSNDPTGLYAGVWASNIKWIEDAGGDAKVEVDLYGGKRGELSDSVTYDVGFIGYEYPSNNLQDGSNSALFGPNTTEAYAQLGFGSFYVKYSQSITNLFGNDESKGSTYWDAGVNAEIATGLTLNLHAGHQKVKNRNDVSYSDWKLGLTKDFGFLAGSLAFVGTDAKEGLFTAKEEYLGKSAVVLTLLKTF